MAAGSAAGANACGAYRIPGYDVLRSPPRRLSR